jgi:hypothetical protein
MLETLILLVKSDFSIELEYILTPNSNSSSPTDPTQIQQTPVQYSKTINIISAELSNSLYKITVNGTLNSFADDNTPSGALTVEIQKSMAFIDYLSAYAMNHKFGDNSVQKKILFLLSLKLYR